MPKVTKAMLEADIKRYQRQYSTIAEENNHLKEKNKLLKERQFDVDAFCRMHAEGMTAVSQAVNALRILMERRIA